MFILQAGGLGGQGSVGSNYYTVDIEWDSSDFCFEPLLSKPLLFDIS